MEAASINEKRLPELLQQFYARVQQDPELGPVFAVVENWPEHIRRLADFWSSVMLRSGRYKGSPVAVHLQLASQISPDMFNRWLSIWHATTDELLPSDQAKALQEKAERIAESLRLALRFGNAETRAKALSAGAAYRSTPEFNEDTLPSALRRSHSTKAGTWGLIHVLQGQVRLVFEDGTADALMKPGHPGMVRPQQAHYVVPTAPFRMRIDFYDSDPQPSTN